MSGIIQDNEKNIVFYLNKIRVHVELDSKLSLEIYHQRLKYFYLLISDISFLCEATTASNHNQSQASGLILRFSPASTTPFSAKIPNDAPA